MGCGLTSVTAIILKWWSEENSKEPNSHVGLWMSLYALLGVVGTLSAFVAGW